MVNSPLEAESVKPSAARFILSPFPAKSATPATAAMDAVPPSVLEPAASLRIDRLTVSVASCTKLSFPSKICATGCVVKATPA